MRKQIAGIGAGIVAVAGSMVGLDYANDITVDTYRFDNAQEYEAKRDEVFHTIETHIDFDKEGNLFLNFYGATIDFRVFSDMYNFVNKEAERCGVTFTTKNFVESFQMVKNCK